MVQPLFIPPSLPFSPLSSHEQQGSSLHCFAKPHTLCIALFSDVCPNAIPVTILKGLPVDCKLKTENWTLFPSFDPPATIVNHLLPIVHCPIVFCLSLCRPDPGHIKRALMVTSCCSNKKMSRAKVGHVIHENQTTTTTIETVFWQQLHCRWNFLISFVCFVRIFPGSWVEGAVQKSTVKTADNARAGWKTHGQPQEATTTDDDGRLEQLQTSLGGLDQASGLRT